MTLHSSLHCPLTWSPPLVGALALWVMLRPAQAQTADSVETETASPVPLLTCTATPERADIDTIDVQITPSPVPDSPLSFLVQLHRAGQPTSTCTVAITEISFNDMRHHVPGIALTLGPAQCSTPGLSETLYSSGLFQSRWGASGRLMLLKGVPSDACAITHQDPDAFNALLNTD